jgi:hypothetical protein
MWHIGVDAVYTSTQIRRGYLAEMFIGEMKDEPNRKRTCCDI